VGEVAPWQLDEVDVAELVLVAEVGQGVLVASPLACAARLSSSRAWPSRSRAMLVERHLVLELGAFVHHSDSRCDMIRASSPSMRQYVASSAASHTGRYGWVDTGERVIEAGAERPPGVVVLLDDRVVGVTHMCGTSSGIL